VETKGIETGKNLFLVIILTLKYGYGKLGQVRGRGVAANMRPCQGRDRGFEPRRSRWKETLY
jgi:hypothetical protein